MSQWQGGRPVDATCRRDPGREPINDEGRHPPALKDAICGRGAALGGDVVAAPLAFDRVDFTQDDGPVAFILLARVSPGERVHDIKNMVSAVHHGDTTEGSAWNRQGAEAVLAAAVH